MKLLPRSLKAAFGKISVFSSAQERFGAETLLSLGCGFSIVRSGRLREADLFDKAWRRKKEFDRNAVHGAAVCLMDMFFCAAQLFRPEDVNARRAPDDTPALVRAILGGNMLHARQLLDAGADPHAADAQGRTAVMAAAFMAETAFLQHLKCSCNADFAAQDVYGRDVLDYALDAPKPSLLCVNFILQEGSTFPGRETAIAPHLLQGNPKIPRIVRALVINKLDIFKAMLDDRRIDFTLCYPQFGGRDLFAICKLFAAKAGLKPGFERALADDSRAAKTLPRDADALHVFTDGECREIFAKSGGDASQVTFYSPYRQNRPVWPN